MTTTAPIDKAGRIVIPKLVRDALELMDGDKLEISLKGEEIRMRVAPVASSLKRKGRFWVHSAGKPMDPDIILKTIDKVRRERSKRILGLR